MDNDYRYGREKLYQAVSCLVGSGSIQERLEYAAVYLIRLQPPREDVPKELHQELDELIKELNRVPASGDEGTIRATANTMSSDEGNALAERILSLYIKIRGGI